MVAVHLLGLHKVVRDVGRTGRGKRAGSVLGHRRGVVPAVAPQVQARVRRLGDTARALGENERDPTRASIVAEQGHAVTHVPGERRRH